MLDWEVGLSPHAPGEGLVLCLQDCGHNLKQAPDNREHLAQQYKASLAPLGLFLTSLCHRPTAIYRYCGVNLNDEGDTRGSLENMDGEIVIHKNCLAEPIIFKSKKDGLSENVPDTNRHVQSINPDKALKNGDIQIKKYAYANIHTECISVLIGCILP